MARLHEETGSDAKCGNMDTRACRLQVALKPWIERRVLSVFMFNSMSNSKITMLRRAICTGQIACEGGILDLAQHGFGATQQYLDVTIGFLYTHLHY